MNAHSNNRHAYRILLGAVLLLLGSACDRQQTVSQPAEGTIAAANTGGESATVKSGLQIAVSSVIYMEKEPGTEPYAVRILVSPAYVRLDDGYDESDFVLLDRKSRQLYSIVHDDQSVLVINNQVINAALPDTLKLTVESSTDDDAPAIAGKQPRHIKYLANEETCRESVSVDGIMQAAVTGMQEFATALGERQFNNMFSVPADMQTPCFLSRYVYASGRLYDNGLPIQIWDASGFYRALTDFSDEDSVAESLFEVPDSYQQLSM